MCLPVKEMASGGSMYHQECIYCGACVDVCPEHAITFGWGKDRSEAARAEG